MGTHQTAAGKVVNLSGLEWLEWDHGAGLSRVDVSNQMGAGGTYEGWRYASRAEVGALLDSLWGGTHEGWHASNLDGGDWLSENMNNYHDWTPDGTNFHFGADSELSAGLSFYGHYRGQDTEDPLGWFQDQYGLSTGLDAIDLQTTGNALDFGDFYGHALVKEAVVPEPATVSLLGIGLFGLAGAEVRRRRKRKAGSKS
ncbi:MAG: PEP-CTERM sorting domain-containing protein [Candidatus Scalindua sp.]|nr:PEP-CTERM sorting domain-containing protein [Candidatus Scalindua sp.]